MIYKRIYIKDFLSKRRFIVSMHVLVYLYNFIFYKLTHTHLQTSLQHIKVSAHSWTCHTLFFCFFFLFFFFFNFQVLDKLFPLPAIPSTHLPLANSYSPFSAILCIISCRKPFLACVRCPSCMPPYLSVVNCFYSNYCTVLKMSDDLLVPPSIPYVLWRQGVFGDYIYTCI